MNQQMKTILFLGFLTALLVGLGSFLGPNYLYVFLILSLALNVGSYFFSDRIILKMYRAREVDEKEAPWLHGVVGELAQKAGIPKPKVCVMDNETPNAFATGRNPSKGVVAVTTGIQRILNPRELRGVLAHEIAHIKNRDTLIATIAAVIGTAISYIGNVFQWTALFGGRQQGDEEKGSPLAGLLMAFLAPLIAMLLQFGISRSREYYADMAGAQISGDPEALASALEKMENFSRRTLHHQDEEIGSAPATSSLFIINPFSGAEGVMKLFSTHPPTSDRIRRLRELQSYASMAA